MANRIIKESIRTSRTVSNMTDFQFRVWVHLITYVDDYGRGSADPEILKGFVFPRRKRVSEKDIQAALSELAGMGCISLYDVDGESYFCFPTWADHQRIRNRTARFPAPENEQQPAASCGELRQVAADCGELRPEVESESESELESESESKRDIRTRSRYGEYRNVLLSNEELEKLQKEFPGHWNDLIDRLSGYMKQSGKTYKDHLATMRNWGRKDGLNASATAGAPLSDMELAAIQRMMGGGAE